MGYANKKKNKVQGVCFLLFKMAKVYQPQIKTHKYVRCLWKIKSILAYFHNLIYIYMVVTEEAFSHSLSSGLPHSENCIPQFVKIYFSILP